MEYYKLFMDQEPQIPLISALSNQIAASLDFLESRLKTREGSGAEENSQESWFLENHPNLKEMFGYFQIDVLNDEQKGKSMIYSAAKAKLRMIQDKYSLAKFEIKTSINKMAIPFMICEVNIEQSIGYGKLYSEFDIERGKSGSSWDPQSDAEISNRSSNRNKKSQFAGKSTLKDSMFTP